MPVRACQRDGKPGYQWGDEGKCFTYTPGDDASRERARQQCLRQARAIQANSEGAPVREYKSFGDTVVETHDEEATVEAIVSVFNNIDSGKERVLPGFFSESLTKRMPIGVWMHDWKSPVSKTLEAKELLPGDERLPDGLKDLGGLYIKGQFFPDIPESQKAYLYLKKGIINEFSIGYEVVRDSFDEESGVRDLIKGTLYEWSPVLVGMNPATQLLSVKSDLDPNTFDNPRALEDYLRDACGFSRAKAKALVAGQGWKAFGQRDAGEALTEADLLLWEKVRHQARSRQRNLTDAPPNYGTPRGGPG